MEDKLEKYRASLRRREKFEQIKQRFIRMVTFSPKPDEKKDEEHIDICEVKFPLNCISIEIDFSNPRYRKKYQTMQHHAAVKSANSPNVGHLKKTKFHCRMNQINVAPIRNGNTLHTLYGFVFGRRVG